MIIISFIPDDIYRCEYSKTFGANKPYFAITNNSLTLKGVPVHHNVDKKILFFVYWGIVMLFI